MLSRVETLPAYIDFLRGNSKELDALYTDVLISVTSFFRDPEAFDFLKKTVFPKIVPTGKDAVMRIWTLGCSTGQEAYSLAMIYAEFTGVMPSAPKLQLFATDLNETLLVKARAGLYAKSIAFVGSPASVKWLRSITVTTTPLVVGGAPAIEATGTVGANGRLRWRATGRRDHSRPCRWRRSR